MLGVPRPSTRARNSNFAAERSFTASYLQPRSRGRGFCYRPPPRPPLRPPPPPRRWPCWPPPPPPPPCRPPPTTRPVLGSTRPLPGSTSGLGVFVALIKKNTATSTTSTMTTIATVGLTDFRTRCHLLSTAECPLKADCLLTSTNATARVFRGQPPDFAFPGSPVGQQQRPLSNPALTLALWRKIVSLLLGAISGSLLADAITRHRGAPALPSPSLPEPQFSHSRQRSSQSSPQALSQPPPPHRLCLISAEYTMLATLCQQSRPHPWCLDDIRAAGVPSSREEVFFWN